MTNDWRNVKLGDIARLVKDGYTPAPEDSTLYIGLEHIEQQNLRLTGWGVASDVTSTKAQFKAGDILFGKLRPYFRKVYRPKFDGICSTDIWVIRAKPGTDQGFLFYLLASYEFIDMTAAGSSGTRMPRADWKYLSNAEWRWKLPPLAEQRQIAAILSSLDDKIEVNQHMNQTLEQLAQTLFRQWFVAFDFPNAAGHPYRSSGGELMKSELGEIPKGWRVGVLSDIITELETGTRPKGGVSTYTTGVPSIGAESIVGIGQFDFSKTKYVPEEYFATMRRGLIKSRDVLIYKDGGKPGNFTPHISMFGDGFPFEICCVNDHVYRLRTKNIQNFTYLWLSSDPIMAEMRQKGTGAAIPGLNSTALKSLTTLLPEAPILTAFEKLIEPLFARIIDNSKQSRTLATLRDTLLPQLLNGRLTVRQAAEMVA